MKEILLLVDDELNILRALTRLLRRDGYHILQATSGRDGLSLLREHGVGVIISDQRMPGMTGVDFVSRAREVNPDAVRMLLSGYADLGAVTEAINQGAVYKFLAKPWDDELLRVNVQEAFRHFELTLKNQHFTKIFETTLEGIIITDAKGVIQSVNPAFSTITGYTIEEVISKNVSMLRSDRHDNHYYKEMWNRLIKEGQWVGEIWNRRKNGELYPESLTISAVLDVHSKVIQYVALFSDITEQKKHEERLTYQAYHDDLTGLPNRLYFGEALIRLLRKADERQKQIAVMFMDLDRFKNVNDCLGHDVGDRLLQVFAQRLSKCVPDVATVARMGGDEFTLLLREVPDIEAITTLAEQVLAVFQKPLSVDDREFFITPSIGISVYPQDGVSSDVLMKHADIAMYRAKEMGGNTFRFYATHMNIGTEQRLALEHSLRKAIDREEFLVYYQPKVDLISGKMVGMEALIRWQHPQRGLVSPLKFIPLAEDTGLIVPIGEWVLQEASRQTKQWREAGYDLRVAVNLSARQFLQQGLNSAVQNTLRISGLEPSALEMELTESVVMGNPEAVNEALCHLKDMGVILSIDDFGTGYSSLAYLKRFPIDILKIDQSFVRDITTDPDDAAIVTAIIQMAHGLKLKVIAEGVRTKDQLTFLYENRCDIIQGSYFSMPLPAADFEALLKEGRSL